VPELVLRSDFLKISSISWEARVRPSTSASPFTVRPARAEPALQRVQHAGRTGCIFEAFREIIHSQSHGGAAGPEATVMPAARDRVRHSTVLNETHSGAPEECLDLVRSLRVLRVHGFQQNLSASLLVQGLLIQLSADLSNATGVGRRERERERR
jgi:hypothetical protein